MKKLFNPVIPDYTPKQERNKKEDESLPSTPCIICQKMTQGYGLWAIGNTCSKDCEALQEAKPKLHGGQPCVP